MESGSDIWNRKTFKVAKSEGCALHRGELGHTCFAQGMRFAIEKEALGTRVVIDNVARDAPSQRGQERATGPCG